ncbi:MAG: DUF3108 domain-containing protein [bacterium]
MKKIVLFLFISSLALCEELVYNVKILGINAGTQRIITKEEGGGIMVISDTKTNKFFSKFYKLDDHIETLVDKETLLPIIIREKIEEGKEKKELTTYLSQDRLEGTIIEGDIRSQINLSKETFNIPSLINLLRNKELKVGNKEEFSIITLGKIENVEVDVESLRNIYFEGEKRVVFKIIAKDVVLWFSREDGIPLIIEVNLKCGLALKGYLKK